MKIKAVPVNSTNFKPFGTYYKVMDGAPRTGTGGWKAWMTPGVCMDDVAHFGFTMVKGMPFTVDTMERHTKTTELIVCGDRPLVLAVADSDPQGHAKAQDMKAFTGESGMMHADVRTAIPVTTISFPLKQMKRRYSSPWKAAA